MTYYKFDEKQLNFKKVNVSILSLIPTLLFGIVFLFMSLQPPVIEKEKQYLENTITIDKNIDKISSEKVKDFIKELKIKNGDIVYKQALLESASFSSTIFIENNNIFGMKMPGNRPTTAIGENRGHAVYLNWRMSIIDYALYQSSYLNDMDREQYIQYIKKNYSETSDYIKRLNLK